MCVSVCACTCACVHVHASRTHTLSLSQTELHTTRHVKQEADDRAPCCWHKEDGKKGMPRAWHAPRRATSPSVCQVVKDELAALNATTGSLGCRMKILQDPLSDNLESKAHLDAAHSVRSCAQQDQLWDRGASTALLPTARSELDTARDRGRRIEVPLCASSPPFL